MAQDSYNAIDGVGVMDEIRLKNKKRVILSTLLSAVLLGIIDPKPTGETFEQTFCGNVYYQVGNAQVVVFNDCDGWDYFDSISLDGIEMVFEDGLDDWFYQEFDDGETEVIISKFINAK